MAERFKSVWTILAVGVLVGAFVGVQVSAQEGQPKTKWDYKLIAWQDADTVASLRHATGDKLSDVGDMARALADEVEPRNHPKLQAGVDARIQERLVAAGAEGWELVWVRNATSINSGFVLPAPSLFLKRRG